jgi:hypothetical protein
VCATLVERGLTEERINGVRDLLKKLEAGSGAPAKPKVSPAEIEKAQKEQREALEALRDWFNDWGTTLRQVFNVKAQIKLGLTTVKRGPSGEEEVVDESESEEEEQEEGQEG